MSNDTSILANTRNTINTVLQTVETGAAVAGKLVQAADIYADIAVSHARGVKEDHDLERIRARAALSKADCEALGVAYTPPAKPVAKAKAS